MKLRYYLADSLCILCLFHPHPTLSIRLQNDTLWPLRSHVSQQHNDRSPPLCLLWSKQKEKERKTRWKTRWRTGWKILHTRIRSQVAFFSPAHQSRCVFLRDKLSQRPGSVPDGRSIRGVIPTFTFGWWQLI